MSNKDPFAPDVQAASSTPAVQQPTQHGDNWASFSFASAPGYDRVAGTIHGSLDFIAESFGIEGFDGKLSTLMKRAATVDSFFKKQFQAGPPAGKG
jgi:hypothetical protein